MPWRALLSCVSVLPFCAVAGDGKLPALAEVVAAGRDLWGEAAMHEPDGASYEFFAPLLPPPRYVHADFRHYPLVLSAPGAHTKARLISDGSGVNLRGGSRSWRDAGTPVVFRVGADEFRFGALRERVSEPMPAEGWLPIYTITYRHPSPVQAEGLVPLDQRPATHEPEVYRLEAFASTDPALAESGVVFVRFTLAAGARGAISVSAEDRTSAWFDRAWKWERQSAHAELKPGTAATLAIFTKPFAAEPPTFDAASFEKHRALTERTWREIVRRAMQVEVPEPRVQAAWRALLVQNFMLLNGDRMHYSAGNQYEQLYCAEGSDAALAMLSWGYEAEAARMFGPLLSMTRKGLEHHQAALKLNDVIRHWWQTRDAEWLRAMRPQWEAEARRLLDGRTGPAGLLPKQRYCGDISTPVNALSSQSAAWRALHDLAPVLRALGDETEAARVSTAAAEFKTHLLDAVEKSVRRESTPPFLPIALLDHEEVHAPITATRIGSYWNLINGYVIGSRLFPPGSAEETWLPHFLEQHGGLCMGMIRAGGTAHAFWTGPDRVNPLYGTRYVLDVLRRDDPERALVSFYGMLAQGFTRETFIAGEGCTLAPVDPGGRFFYCPPNSAANAHFLTMLRTLLVQDLDLNGDGEPETLRLGFATPRRWLADGQRLAIERAPTAFGPVSWKMESQLASGAVLAEVTLPTRHPPPHIFLRARVPSGWRITAAEAEGTSLAVDDRGTVNLSGRRGTVRVRLSVAR